MIQQKYIDIFFIITLSICVLYLVYIYPVEGSDERNPTNNVYRSINIYCDGRDQQTKDELCETNLELRDKVSEIYTLNRRVLELRKAKG